MRLATTIGSVALALATAGCGVLFHSGSGFMSIEPGPGLVAANDAGSGSHALTAIRFMDVATHTVVFETPAAAAAGASASLEAAPAGPYDVVGVFDDGYVDAGADGGGYRVNVDPAAAANVAFRHP